MGEAAFAFGAALGEAAFAFGAALGFAGLAAGSGSNFGTDRGGPVTTCAVVVAGGVGRFRFLESSCDGSGTSPVSSMRRRS